MILLLFIFHIDLTLNVAMITENGSQYSLKERENVILDHNSEILETVFLNIDISTAKCKKDIFVFMNHH